MENRGMILVYGAEGATKTLEYMLSGYGFCLLRSEDRQELTDRFRGEETVLLLFDLQMGAGSETEALTLLAELRQSSEKPIVVIADRAMEMLRILALNAGADELLDSECTEMEALARIQAQIRCYRRLSKLSERKLPEEKLPKEKLPKELKELEVDDSAKVVRVRGNEVILTPTEYKILRLLMEKPGRVLSNRQIYESIWKMEPIGADNTVAVHIRHIREKIEDNPQQPRYLRVVWGQGYKVG